MNERNLAYVSVYTNVYAVFGLRLLKEKERTYAKFNYKQIKGGHRVLWADTINGASCTRIIFTANTLYDGHTGRLWNFNRPCFTHAVLFLHIILHSDDVHMSPSNKLIYF